MNIAIRNYLAGSYLLETEPLQWDAIVILDPGLTHADFVETHSKRQLFLRFDDVVEATAVKRAPTPEDIATAIEFAEHSQNLLVCCRAGQSRSAAIAFLICHQHEGAEAARKLLNPERHIPNSLIVDIGVDLLDDAAVMHTFLDWQSEFQHVKLSDHYDDIEREIDELEQRGATNRICKT